MSGLRCILGSVDTLSAVAAYVDQAMGYPRPGDSITVRYAAILVDASGTRRAYLISDANRAHVQAYFAANPDQAITETDWPTDWAVLP